MGGEKLGLRLNSAQLGLEAWAELGNIYLENIIKESFSGSDFEILHLKPGLTLCSCIDVKFRIS